MTKEVDFRLLTTLSSFDWILVPGHTFILQSINLLTAVSPQRRLLEIVNELHFMNNNKEIKSQKILKDQLAPLLLIINTNPFRMTLYEKRWFYPY